MAAAWIDDDGAHTETAVLVVAHGVDLAGLGQEQRVALSHGRRHDLLQVLHRIDPLGYGHQRLTNV
jgi:hypothetical protein